jgi:quinol monooxygenase YgiN
VAGDPLDADALWVTEVWDSAASHAASLSLPHVRQAMAKGKPLIASFGDRFETSRIGGVGLSR